MQLIKNIGDTISDFGTVFSSVTGIGLKTESATQFEDIRNSYAKQSVAQVPKVGPVPGTRSIFNPWRVFRYSGFGLDVSNYRYDLHLDSSFEDVKSEDVSRRNNKFNILNVGNDSGLDNPTDAKFKAFDTPRRAIENPTASQIIAWAQNTAGQKQRNPGWGSPVPYTASDFLWCKYYGKVPNNRLVTLRRYPIPVEDEIPINPNVSPLIPLAQAITWYGKDIGNPLNQILNLKWGLNWSPRDSKVQNVNGNEVSVDEILDVVLSKDAGNAQLKAYLRDLLFSGDQNIDLLKVSGYDAKLQSYLKDAWNDDGPYWNRIYGPINVVDQTQIRDVGFMRESSPVSLVFEYSLRSYGGVNPKIAFLDLLTNFLSLTYNTAPFWGGGIRYFQRTGVTVPGLGMSEHLLNNDLGKGISTGLEQMMGLAGKNIDALQHTISAILGKIQAGTTSYDGLNQEGKVNAVQKYVSSKITELLQAPLQFRAFTDGRAVGEWHVTVGNPMNPIAMIGNLCLKDVTFEMGEALGIDDFPTEFKFTVNLIHGRPRAKQDIESMFNLGNGAMGYSEMVPPASASNSYGEKNKIRSTSIQSQTGGADQDVDANNKTRSTVATEQLSADDETVARRADRISRYASRVEDLYGANFVNADRRNLETYFTNLNTKD